MRDVSTSSLTLVLRPNTREERTVRLGWRKARMLLHHTPADVDAGRSPYRFGVALRDRVAAAIAFCANSEPKGRREWFRKRPSDRTIGRAAACITRGPDVKKKANIAVRRQVHGRRTLNVRRRHYLLTLGRPPLSWPSAHARGPVRICVLSLFHGAHRFRFTLCDGLQIKRLNELINVFCYGGAIVLSLWAGYLLWVVP